MFYSKRKSHCLSIEHFKNHTQDQKPVISWCNSQLLGVVIVSYRCQQTTTASYCWRRHEWSCDSEQKKCESDTSTESRRPLDSLWTNGGICELKEVIGGCPSPLSPPAAQTFMSAVSVYISTLHMYRFCLQRWSSFFHTQPAGTNT